MVTGAPLRTKLLGRMSGDRQHVANVQNDAREQPDCNCDVGYRPSLAEKQQSPRAACTPAATSWSLAADVTVGAIRHGYARGKGGDESNRNRG